MMYYQRNKRERKNDRGAVEEEDEEELEANILRLEKKKAM